MTRPSTQGIIYLVVALAAMAAIGVSYERCIGPSQPVWHEDARTWEKVPLSVSWDRGFWGKSHSESFEVAVAAINKEVGFRLLVELIAVSVDIPLLSANGEPCAQSVVFHEETVDAEAWLCKDGTAEVQIYHPGTNNCSARIAMHEWGHTLGLAHTPFGIMRSKIGCDALMIFSDAQRSALRKRYGSPEPTAGT